MGLVRARKKPQAYAWGWARALVSCGISDHSSGHSTGLATFRRKMGYGRRPAVSVRARVIETGGLETRALTDTAGDAGPKPGGRLKARPYGALRVGVKPWQAKADEGVGRGPGGPPHNSLQTV